MNTDEREAVEVVLQRIAEGMSTIVDAEFLRLLLEKLAPDPAKQPVEQNSAS